MWCALICAVSLAQSAPTSDSFFTRTEAAIAAEEHFLALHRGFIAYLRDHPEVLNAERAWWDVAIEPSMADAAARFDEALLGDAEASDALDAAYDLLARDPTLRQNVDALQRIEFTQPNAKALVGDGLRAWRANPDLAMRTLRSLNAPQETKGALGDFLSYLRQRPGLGEELGSLFSALGEAPLAQTRLFPWWQKLAQNNGAGLAYAAMAQQFMEAPRRFWAWHARELAWASDAQARAWARFLYRRARRIPDLGGAYVHYLRAVFEQGTRLDAAERTFAKFGPAPAFPPKPAPPVLPPLQKPDAVKPDKKRAGKPSIAQVPIDPIKPPRPAMPTLPKLEMRKYTPRSTR